MKVREFYMQRMVPLLKFATKAVDKIPTRADTWPQRITKVLSLLDAGQEVYGGGRSKMWELRQRHRLVERDSETFVRLFFATTLRDFFTMHREPLDEHEELIEAVAPDGERLFFRESHYSGYRSDFYATPGLDFTKVIDKLWGAYPDGIYLSVTVEPGGWRREITICEVPPVTADRLSRKASEHLKRVVDVHRNFVADKTHRCYLSYGPAGTGKTTFEVLFARAFGGRALMLDAASLPILNVNELGFLLDALKPGFLIIDDIDRAQVTEVCARILFMLVRLKSRYPAMTVLLSANDPAKLDEALLRCGRIDIPLPFEAPDRDETEGMVTSMLRQHGVPEWRATRDVVGRIVDGSTDFPHADLDDLCRRLRHEELDDVLTSVRLLRSLAEKAAAKGDSKPGAGAPPTSPPA